jgi:hypothetical protein
MEKFERARNLLSDDFFLEEMEAMRQSELLNIVNSCIFKNSCFTID